MLVIAVWSKEKSVLDGGANPPRSTKSTQTVHYRHLTVVNRMT